jgi:hypothetical protein
MSPVPPVRERALAQQPILVVVGDQIEAGKAGVDVEARDPQRVVVIPQRRRLLVVRVVIDLPRPLRADLLEARREPCLRVAVTVIGNVPTVQVHNSAHERAAVRVVSVPARPTVHRGVDGEQVPFG